MVRRPYVVNIEVDTSLEVETRCGQWRETLRRAGETNWTKLCRGYNVRAQGVRLRTPMRHGIYVCVRMPVECQ